MQRLNEGREADVLEQGGRRRAEKGREMRASSMNSPEQGKRSRADSAHDEMGGWRLLFLEVRRYLNDA